MNNVGKENLGKYLLDVSKLIFGGVIISSIMKQEPNITLIIILGISTSIFCAVGGLFLIKKSK